MAPGWDRDAVGELLAGAGVDAWGVAANAPPLPLAPSLPTAVALLKRFAVHELLGVEEGPHETYYAGYRRLNAALDAAAVTLVEALRTAGFQAEHVPPTVPEELYESIDDWGDAGVFAHKTAATRAGLGWIGKTALFVSSDFGPRVRLATVFTDLVLEAGTPSPRGAAASAAAASRPARRAPAATSPGRRACHAKRCTTRRPVRPRPSATRTSAGSAGSASPCVRGGAKAEARRGVGTGRRRRASAGGTPGASRSPGRETPPARREPGGGRLDRQVCQAGLTFTAWGPLRPSVTSNSTA